MFAPMVKCTLLTRSNQAATTHHEQARLLTVDLGARHHWVHRSAQCGEDLGSIPARTARVSESGADVCVVDGRVGRQSRTLR